MRPLILALLSAATLAAQSTTTATTMTAATPHLAVRALVDPETAAPGSEITMTFDVTPARRIHVYAPGADYQVVSVKLDPLPGLKARDLVYPPSEIYHFVPLDERVPVYSKPFTLKQSVLVSALALKGKEKLTLSGKLEYQACDDRVCFKPSSLPFKFELNVKR